MAARKTTTNPTAAEALDEPISFDFEGHTYSVPPAGAWSLDALERFEDGKILTFLRDVLSAEDYRTFKAAHSRVDAMSDFMEALQKALGIAGN